MIQVENEIGMLPDARSYDEAANAAFNQPVPRQLLNYLQTNKDNLVPELKSLWEKNGYKTSGSWEDIFGKSLSIDEGKFENGKWLPGRRMNGDQDHQGRHVRISVDEWNIQRVKLYQYK
jgi:hypothetical protein